MDLQPLKYFDSLYPPSTRQRELKLLIPFIEKGLSSQLIGIPGSGKSNVLRLLAYNKEARAHNFGEYEKVLHFVYIDCSELKNKPLFDITKFILISLSFSLGERGLIDESRKVNDLLKEGLETHDEMMLFQSIKKSLDYLSIEKKLTIHLLFDKFDLIVPQLTSDFFTNLKVLRNHAKYRFASVFSVTRPLEELIDPTLMEDFQDLIADNTIYVELYDNAWLDFRLSYIERAARKTLDQDIKEKVLALSGGHSELSKLSYETLVTEEHIPEDLEQYLLKKGSIQGSCSRIWKSLLPSEQVALKNNVSYADATDKFPYLTNGYLISENGPTIPIFTSYIKSVPVENTEKLIFDEDKNEIILGEFPISDRLSPLEFKLLKYLINNKERLCNKDEIISNVWGDQKSFEGVTDQALDQIFYRLRKKIENDPANPHYIHTIKGKGYKLSD